MARLIACPSCHAHAWSTEPTCPHCGTPLKTVHGAFATTAAAALLGLLPVACDGGSASRTSSVPQEVHYGVPDDEPRPAEDAMPDDKKADTKPTPAPEPEYGVPITDETQQGEPPPPVPEPEYGVPISDDKPDAQPKPATDPMLEPAYGAVAGDGDPPMPSTAPAPPRRTPK